MVLSKLRRSTSEKRVMRRTWLDAQWDSMWLDLINNVITNVLVVIRDYESALDALTLI